MTKLKPARKKNNKSSPCYYHRPPGQPCPFRKKKSFLSLSNSWVPWENPGGWAGGGSGALCSGGLEGGGHRCLLLEQMLAAISFSERLTLLQDTWPDPLRSPPVREITAWDLEMKRAFGEDFDRFGKSETLKKKHGH